MLQSAPPPKNYAITSLLVVATKETQTTAGTEVLLTSKVLAAIPNHPMNVGNSKKRIGGIEIGEAVTCLNEQTQVYETYTVFNKKEAAGGNQKVYNMVLSSGGGFYHKQRNGVTEIRQLFVKTKKGDRANA